MKSKMAVIIGCLALVGTFGGGHLLFQPVGSPVSQFEAGKVMGGACYQYGSNRPKVCSNVNTCSGGTCGCRNHLALIVTTSSGFTRQAPQACDSDTKCTIPRTLTDASCGG